MANRLTEWLGKVMALGAILILSATTTAVAIPEPDLGLEEKEECSAEISGQAISLYFQIVERLERVRDVENGAFKLAPRRYAVFFRGQTGGTIAEQVVAILHPLFENAVQAGGVRMGDRVVRFRPGMMYELVLQVNVCTDGVVHGAPRVLDIFELEGDKCPAQPAHKPRPEA